MSESRRSMKSIYISIQLRNCLLSLFVALGVSGEAMGNSYGVDVSMPIHHRVSLNYPWLPHNVDRVNSKASPLLEKSPLQILGDRHQLYVDHLKGCRENSKDPSECDRYELNRILMNLRQPQSVKNYTGEDSYTKSCILLL